MTNHSKPPVGPALEASLDRLAITFRGMTAHPDEYNCECHWGSAEDLAHLKMPGLELEPDLLRRTWQAPDWNDHASVLRRVLPQLAVTLVNGGIDDYYLEDVGLSFARGNWQHWPTEQVAAVRAFLHAWWTHCLTAADAAVPAHAALALCSEAAGTVGPWLAAWEAITHPLADQRLAEALAHWDFLLLEDDLPWSTLYYEEDKRTELTAWLLRHAPARIGAHGDADHLGNVLRLLAISDHTRWDDPHWPFPAYE